MKPRRNSLVTRHAAANADMAAVCAALVRVQQACRALPDNDPLAMQLNGALFAIEQQLACGHVGVFDRSWLHANDRYRLLHKLPAHAPVWPRRADALSAWDELLDLGWPTSDRRFGRRTG